nr:hypothetical protein CFP56_27394 [Quercus suber]
MLEDLEHKVFILLKISLCSNAQSTKPTSEVQKLAVGDSVSKTPKKRKSCSNSQPKADTIQTKDNVSEIDYIDVLVGDLSNTAQSQKPVIDLENKDAVCTRTRVCYSLASFTLDELKTFLQETDYDDDFQNVDGEEEYRKFLAAVLNSGDGDGQSNQENEIVDDEDEDNDVDFEIEIQELLESDVDEST